MKPTGSSFKHSPVTWAHKSKIHLTRCCCPVRRPRRSVLLLRSWTKHHSPSVWPHAEDWVAEDEGAHRSLLSQNVPHYRARLPENNSYLALAFDMHKKSITQNKNDDRSLNRGALWNSRPTVPCLRKAFPALCLDFMPLSNTNDRLIYRFTHLA